jgi:hypothetical protein
MHLTKTIVAVTSLLALCAITFSVAYYVGERRGADSATTSLVGAKALDERTVLKMIERSVYDEAIAYLNGSIDADVLQLDALSTNATNGSVREDIRRVLKVIADDRKRAASNHYPVIEVDERVKAILESVDEGK